MKATLQLLTAPLPGPGISLFSRFSYQISTTDFRFFLWVSHMPRADYIIDFGIVEEKATHLAVCGCLPYLPS